MKAMSSGQPAEELAQAGRALGSAGLVTAFGHVSVRIAPERLLITPPRPLATLDETGSGFRELPLAAGELPPDTPREAWMHVAIAKARPEVGAVCRAQPPSTSAVSAVGIPLVPLHGQGALLGPEVPVFPDSRLVRDSARAARLADTLGPAAACVLRGNGAITVGATVAEAVARMWILEESARLALAAAAAGTPTPLPAEEQEAWAATGAELLNRIWQYLTGPSR
jgi:HCOMODA/2-hydroxy-3-carboxy-muconic semialdehyde decarboxylase